MAKLLLETSNEEIADFMLGVEKLANLLNVHFSEYVNLAALRTTQGVISEATLMLEQMTLWIPGG